MSTYFQKPSRTIYSLDRVLTMSYVFRGCKFRFSKPPTDIDALGSFALMSCGIVQSVDLIYIYKVPVEQFPFSLQIFKSSETNLSQKKSLKYLPTLPLRFSAGSSNIVETK